MTPKGDTMNTAQLEQYRDLLARMSKARTADAATTDALVLAVAVLVEEVERLQAQLAAVPVDAITKLRTHLSEDGDYSICREDGEKLFIGELIAFGSLFDTIDAWLDAEQDAANAAAELRAPTYGGGCW